MFLSSTTTIHHDTVHRDTVHHDTVHHDTVHHDTNIIPLVPRSVVVEEGVVTADGLAVDWVANNIYWTDVAYNWIKIANYDGSVVRTLVTTGMDIPAGIACDPKNG